MNHCHLGEDGAFYISQGLIKNKRLKTLLLSGNDLGNNGVSQFSEYLAYTSFNLEHLDFSNNDITDLGAEGIARNLGGNRHLLTLNLQKN